MTVQEIKTLHAYSSWATNRVFDALARIPEDTYLKDMKSSHGGIHGTLVHMIGAQIRWAARFSGVPENQLPSMGGPATLKDAKAAWEKAGYDLAKVIGTMTDKKLQDEFTMILANGQKVSLTFVQGFLHLIDHTTFHRGQIIGMIRQAGITPPATGLMGFFRETGGVK